VHAFIYMDTAGIGEGTRYDVGLDNPVENFSSAVFGVGEGFVQRKPRFAGLNQVRIFDLCV